MAHLPIDIADNAPVLHLIDASLYVFRAWHSIPNEFFDSDGYPLNAVHGFCRFILDVLEKQNPEYMVVAFDEALDSCFRNKIYPAYKANREAAPEELHRQFAHCKALCAALGLNVLAHTEYEADDLIGSALFLAQSRAMRGIIYSADKDLSQLLGKHDEQWDYPRGERWNLRGVKQKFGVYAHQIADYLALTGDSVDNIPGVTGIGAKTAAVLLSYFGSLDQLLKRIEEIPFLRIRGAAQIAQRLREQKQNALLWRKLTTVALNAPLIGIEPDFKRSKPDTEMLNQLCSMLHISSYTRQRLLAVVKLG